MSEYELTLLWLRTIGHRVTHAAIHHGDYYRMSSKRYATRAELASLLDDIRKLAQWGERIQRWLDEWDSEVDDEV